MSTSAASARGGGDVEERLDRTIESLSFSAAVPRTRRSNDNWLCQLDVYALLDTFGFGRSLAYKPLSRCSGGERRRLQLMELLMKQSNFLILDEVSNDLDVQTLSMVEEVLTRYTGVLVLCSHDRFMLDRLVDKLIVLEGDGVVDVVEGKFTEYLEVQRAAKRLQREQERGNYKKKDRERKIEQKKRLSYMEKKEYEGLEKEIEELQTRYDETVERLQTESGSADVQQIVEWGEAVAQLEKTIESKTERWLALAEIAEA